MTPQLDAFAHHFLKRRMNWWRDIPRIGGVYNFGNIISLILYRKDPMQVELFIVPDNTSTFTPHRHPNVNVYEFHLTGDAVLYRDGVRMASPEYVAKWLHGDIDASLLSIPSTCIHSGAGFTPYAFLSIQEWLNGVPPSSVGLDWEGEPSSVKQQQMLDLRDHQSTEV